MRREGLPDMCECDHHLVSRKHALGNQVRWAEAAVVEGVEICGDVASLLGFNAERRHRRSRSHSLRRQNPAHQCLAFIPERSRDERPIRERIEWRSNAAFRTGHPGNVVTVPAAVIDDERSPALSAAACDCLRRGRRCLYAPGNKCGHQNNPDHGPTPTKQSGEISGEIPWTTMRNANNPEQTTSTAFTESRVPGLVTSGLLITKRLLFPFTPQLSASHAAGERADCGNQRDHDHRGHSPAPSDRTPQRDNEVKRKEVSCPRDRTAQESNSERPSLHVNLGHRYNAAAVISQLIAE
jgi:hypothetical protein